MGYSGAGPGSCSASSREYGLLMPSPSHLHCVAAILWHSYELPVDYDLPALLSRELFQSVSLSLFGAVGMGNHSDPFHDGAADSGSDRALLSAPSALGLYVSLRLICLQ